MIGTRLIVGGGASAAGVLIYWKDGTTTFLSSSVIFGNEYDQAKSNNGGSAPNNWSIEFTLSNGLVDKTWDSGNGNFYGFVESSETYTIEEDPFTGEDTGTKARIPVRVGGNRINLFGAFSEELVVINGIFLTQFYKVG